MRTPREIRSPRGKNPNAPRRWTAAVLEQVSRLQARQQARRADRATRQRRSPRPARRVDLWTRTLAWGVHLYTAMGLVVAAAVAVLLVRGGPEAFRRSFLLMAVATAIDATDGTLARWVRVKDVLPQFDGRKLDDITDFLTYTFLPLLLIWRAELLPAGTAWCLMVPLLASAYGFCQVAAKTDDGYFLGFPSLWNVVAFYLYILPIPGPWAVATVLLLAVLTFVPSRYLYPSQPGRLNAFTNLLAVGWAVALGWILYRMPTHPATPGRFAAGSPFPEVALASLIYPAFYLAASWLVTLRHWRGGRRGRVEA